MELRCLVSSRNASENFDLRCLVREEMTAWIQQNHPTAFPTTRLSAISGPLFESGDHNSRTSEMASSG
jgi:hypothetical protein